jgi:hypothetical protein
MSDPKKTADGVQIYIGMIVFPHKDLCLCDEQGAEVILSLRDIATGEELDDLNPDDLYSTSGARIMSGCEGHRIGNPNDGYDYDCDHEYSGDIACEDCIFGPHPDENSKDPREANHE